jgi:hypothetical protein
MTQVLAAAPTLDGAPHVPYAMPAGTLRLQRRNTLALAGIALLAGATLYLGRIPTLAEHWTAAVPLTSVLRTIARPLLQHVPNWFLGSAPDGLWALALALTLGAVTRRRYFALAQAAGVSLALGYEAAQAVGLVRGTFDWLDILAIAISYAIGAAFAARANAHKYIMQLTTLLPHVRKHAP